MTQKQTAREDFHAFRQRLLDAGYREKDVTFSAGRATGLGLVCALPFATLLLVVYRLALVHRAHLIDISGVSFYIALVLILALSVFAHELLHGLGWAVSSGRGWKAVRFNVSALMPSCACTVPLRRGQYLLGALLPFCILGGGSALFLAVYPGTFSVVAMLVNFIAAGGDLLIAFHVMREKGALIADHPTAAGYIAFCR